jgi:putative PIN family toxin of toxin-antitoxin system
MGALKVVIDTNVVISALLFGGGSGKLVASWQRGIIKPAASKKIIDKYLRVLTYPKFKLSEEEINYLLYQEIIPYFDIIDAQPGPRIVKKDPEDDKFIRCALAAGAEYIISGDKHLLALKEYQKIRILSPSEFIANRIYSKGVG